MELEAGREARMIELRQHGRTLLALSSNVEVHSVSFIRDTVKLRLETSKEESLIN